MKGFINKHIKIPINVEINVSAFWLLIDQVSGNYHEEGMLVSSF